MKGSGLAAAKAVTWTNVKPGHFKTDYFPTVPGPKGSAASEPKQMKVLKDYEYRGKEGDLLTSGGLDHISYIDRKPKPMGTEFKCVCDGRHGLMFYLEIQEGSSAMTHKKFRDVLAPASATGTRMALGTTCGL